jgi:hypothetical protein
VVDVLPNPNGGLAIVIEPPTLGVVVIVVPDEPLPQFI